MTRIAIESKMILWAIERANLDYVELTNRFPKLPEWENGDLFPTLKQLENFAKAVHVPIGYLFMSEPPEEQLPIPDFRTLDGKEITRPSPNLLDTIYSCQERQSWFKDFAKITKQPPHEYIGSLNTKTSVEFAASLISKHLSFNLKEREKCNTWEEALRMFIAQADTAGILVMISGIVHSNTQRRLNLEEFRGFALADKHAPLIFINGTDTKSGQMFTLAHELAHLWLNLTGLSNSGLLPKNGYRREEIWCNAVAAELLVPLSSLRKSLLEDEEIPTAIHRLSRKYKVSSLVIIRRLLDVKWYDRQTFDQVWTIEIAKLKEISARARNGGSFYPTAISRASKRFTKAIITSTLEGQTLYRDAYRMLGIKKNETFNELGRKVDVMF